MHMSEKHPTGQHPKDDGAAPRLVPLPGSERPAAADQHASTPQLPPDTPVDATVVLRRRSEPPAGLAPMPREQWTAAYGADPADVTLASRVLGDLGLAVMTADAASRRLRVEGTAAAVARVFGTTLSAVDAAAAGGRRRSGGLSIPAELDGVVTAVLGLDDRPQGRTRYRVAQAAASATSYTPLELGKVYRFPADTDGSGQTIAILELGGGYTSADLDSYFNGLCVPTPQLSAVGVDGAGNAPTNDPNGPDGEVLLDIEVAGALAPKAALVVYFAPNTDAGFLDALSEAAHASPAPAAISISWGQSEDDWTAQSRIAFDDALTDAAGLGATVTVAAGDDGSSDRVTDGKVHVDFPASSPHALACGGTRLDADTSGSVSSEVVWGSTTPGATSTGATGGGVSDAFPLPGWQATAGVPGRAGGGTGRGVPDVAAVADPQTGYRVRVDGTDIVIGGTSAVAPLWAALVARLVQATGKPLGLLQPAIYGATAAGATAPGFRDITSGGNGAYTAAPGWDPCTGLGVPDGDALLAALKGSAATTAN